MVPWPVSARKTSSRSGVCTEKPAARTPAASSRSSRARSASSPPSPATRRARFSSSRAAPGKAAAARSYSSGPVNRSRTWAPGMRAFSSSAVPSATIRPPSRTAIRSANWSASSRYWVVRKTVVPPATSERTVSHMVRRLRGSSPVVGSSRKITWGSPTRVMARSSRRRIPPEKVAARFLATSAMSNRSSNSLVRARPSRLPRRSRSAMRRRFSSAVRRSSSAANCPVTPIAERTPSGAVWMSWPATRAWPPSAAMRVERICTVVVLPAPLGPSRANTVPAGMARSMPSSTVLSPYDLRRPVTETASGRGSEAFLGVGMTDEGMEPS